MDIFFMKSHLFSNKYLINLNIISLKLKNNMHFYI